MSGQIGHKALEENNQTCTYEFYCMGQMTDTTKWSHMAYKYEQ